MIVKYKFLFNFAVTKTGGGLKRLYEYSKWFHENGGAWFIINSKCNFLKKKFPNNKYFVVFQTRLQRIFKDCEYLSELKKEINKPDLYYSYGIPIYYQIGKINWFHISNILPFKTSGMGLTLFDRYVRLSILRWKIKKNYQNADIVSAESEHSLNMIKNKNIKETFLSLNGSDDEINYLQNKCLLDKKDIAVIVGTQKYKALIDAYYVFEFLKKKNKFLKLIIVGDQKSIPKQLIKNDSVILKDVIQQRDVIELLKKAKYYISTTKIENSFNAASEGVIFANESYISNIRPHRELLRNESYDLVPIHNLSDKVIKVKGKNIEGKNLMLWRDVIKEMITRTRS